MTNTDLGGATGEPGKRSPDGDASPKDMAVAAVQTVREEAATFAQLAKDKALDQVAQKKGAAGETLGDFANAVRKAGEELAQADQSTAGRIVKQAADGLEGLSRAVSDKRPEELLAAARDFGRQNPTAFLAGSVLLGFALGRFARSSEHHGEQAEAEGGGPPQPGHADAARTPTLRPQPDGAAAHAAESGGPGDASSGSGT